MNIQDIYEYSWYSRGYNPQMYFIIIIFYYFPAIFRPGSKFESLRFQSDPDFGVKAPFPPGASPPWLPASLPPFLPLGIIPTWISWIFINILNIQDVFEYLFHKMNIQKVEYSNKYSIYIYIYEYSCIFLKIYLNIQCSHKAHNYSNKYSIHVNKYS